MFRVKEQSPEVFAREVAEPFRKILAEEVLGRIDGPAAAGRPALAEGLRPPEVDRLRGGARRLPRRLRLGRAAGAQGHQGGREAAGRGLPARPQRPAQGRDRGGQPGLSRLRGPAGGARLHHLRPAQPLPRRGPLPDAQPQGQPAQAVDVLVHHRRSTSRSCAGSERCRSWTPSGSPSTA